jgi:tRNA threonylcarbamoyladenosine biosynthesis protein TsaB
MGRERQNPLHPITPPPHLPINWPAAPRRAIALETSGRLGSLATLEDGRVLAEEVFPADFKHAAGVVSAIDRLTKSHGWTPRDLTEVYVSAGPGSFTGLRVGITVAKTLALSLDVKLVAVPTTEVLVENAPPDARHVLIVLDAKRDQIFTTLLSRVPAERVAEVGDEWLTRVSPPHLNTLTAMLASSPRPVHLLGEGVPYHRKFIPADPGIIVTDEARWRPRAAAVASRGWRRARVGEFTDPDRLTPTYIRRPEAEEKWELNHEGTKRTKGTKGTK